MYQLYSCQTYIRCNLELCRDIFANDTYSYYNVFFEQSADSMILYALFLLSIYITNN